MEQKVTKLKRGQNGHNYTKDEINAIRNAYESRYTGAVGWLDKLSTELGRSKTNICRYAKQNGWTDKNGTRGGKGAAKLSMSCINCSKLFSYAKTYKEERKYCSPKCATEVNGKSMIGVRIYKEHPRGMLGKHHNNRTKKRLSDNLKMRWADPNSELNSEEHRQKISDRMSILMVNRIKNSPNSIYSRTNKGWAEFSGGKRYYLKSGWELRYATHLDTLLKGKAILDWTYEENTFWFEKIKRGVRSYTPDFKIYFKDGTHEYHEVKGWMDKKSATKLKRMGIYHPKETVIVIASEEMKNI